MNKSVLAKVFGWAQFVLQTVAFTTQPSYTPHGVSGWATYLSSLLLAAGVHHASNTNGTN